MAINGDDTLVPLIVEHSGIGKISFTGSTATGKWIMEFASRTLKNITLELGGNNATIVCRDVDVASVAPQVALGTFFNPGQVCVASKRIYVRQDIYSEFLAAITAVVNGWKVGPVAGQDAMLGQVQNQRGSTKLCATSTMIAATTGIASQPGQREQLWDRGICSSQRSLPIHQMHLGS